MNVSKLLFLLIILFIPVITATAQEKTVLAGVVRDEKLEPIPGVSIVITKGETIIGTISNMDGKYTIEIPDSIKTFRLVYQFVGMKTLGYIVNKDPINKKNFIFKPILNGKN